MAIKIGINIASLQAQRRLGEATSSLGKIYERLSSGQRINSASDDAAGLAIAEDLKSKSRIFTQAIRNGNDGISLLNIADSAIENLSQITTRIRELAEQAANGTYSSKQRDALDKEAQALKAEYLRIAKTTIFNGIKLFDGSLGSGLNLQLGIGSDGAISTSVGGAIGTGTFGSATSTTAKGTKSLAVSLGDLNGDGILDMVTSGYIAGRDGYATVRLGTGNGTFGTATSYSTESSASLDLALGDLNGDGILDLVTAGQSDGNDGLATVRLGNGNGTFGSATSFTTESYFTQAVSLADINNDGILDLLTSGVSDSNAGAATVRLGIGNGTFGSATSYTTEANSSAAVAVGDLNGDGILDLITSGFSVGYGSANTTVRLGNGDGSFRTASTFRAWVEVGQAIELADLNGDGKLDMVIAGQSGPDGYSAVHLGNGNGTFATAVTYTTESASSTDVVLADVNGDGFLDMLTTGTADAGGGGYGSIRLGMGNGSFGASTSFTTENSQSFGLAMGDLDGDGILDFVTSGRSTGYVGISTVRLGQSQSGVSPLLNFSLKTKADALQAMAGLQRTQDNLAKQRGIIGANQSRVGIAISNLHSSKENFSAAESRIRDADIAQDAANLVRTQILQQAATAILAQANQAPAIAVKLLKN